ncbi:MAG: hypothetical protein KJO69_06960 [Gammaproteobacteria bacterium]|nr:hypothetical protein [Gammaproteobacteria bacterium]
MTPPPRIRLRLRQVRLTQLRLATRPLTTQVVPLEHQELLRLRTTQVAVLLIQPRLATPPHTIPVMPRVQVDRPLRVGQLPTEQVAAQAEQQLPHGIQVLGLLAVQAEQRLQAGLHLGLLRYQSQHRLPIAGLHLQAIGKNLAVRITLHLRGVELGLLLRAHHPILLVVKRITVERKCRFYLIHIHSSGHSTPCRGLALALELHQEAQVDLPLQAGRRTGIQRVAQVDLPPQAGRRTTTQVVEPLNPQRLRSIQRPRMERHMEQASLRLRLTRLRLAQATTQRPRLTQRLRLVRHTALVTIRLLRLTLTLHAPLVMQLARADQRPQTATHQLWFTNA